MGDAELHEQALFSQHQRELREAKAEGIREGMEQAAMVVDECERGEHGGLANASRYIRAVGLMKRPPKVKSPIPVGSKIKTLQIIEGDLPINFRIERTGDGSRFLTIELSDAGLAIVVHNLQMLAEEKEDTWLRIE